MIEPGYCQCGCGQTTNLAPQTCSRRGWVKGQPMQYLRGHAGGRKSPGYQIDESTGCWNWLGFVNADGYGVMWIRGKEKRAHRVYFERLRGSIPNGYQLHHLCQNRRCVNPEHVQVLTAGEHSNLLPSATRSAIARGRRLSDETKAKIGAIHKGKTLTAEHRASVAAAQRGRIKSPEERAKRSASLKAYWQRRREQHQ